LTIAALRLNQFHMSRTLLLFVGLLAAFVGCGGPAATVQGTVTIDGEVARRGTVQFHPVEGGPTAYGSIADDGSYAIRVGQGDLSDPDASDVPLGEYIVTVVVNMPSRPDDVSGEGGPPKPGARLSAAKYGNKDTSDLRHTVTAGRNVVPLEIEGASADEQPADGEATEVAPATEPPDVDQKEAGDQGTPEDAPTAGEPPAPADEPTTNAAPNNDAPADAGESTDASEENSP
jgi:hypothetical protein